jgi:Tol biopolymer transport system component
VVRLTESSSNQVPGSWHPSGRYLAFHQQNQLTSTDVMLLPMEGDEASGWKPGKPTAFRNGPAQEFQSAFSPDGKWLAYVANDSGRWEVNVTPFPGPGGKWQLSEGGGWHPTWSRSRRELFYVTQAGRLMVVPYSVDGNTFRGEKPQPWPAARIMARSFRDFDLHPDGQRFAARKAANTETELKQDKVVFILNFFDELRRIAPAGGR